MKVIFVRTYEIDVKDLQELDQLARTWDEDGEISETPDWDPDDDPRLAILAHAIDGGDLSDIAAQCGHSFLYINPNTGRRE